MRLLGAAPRPEPAFLVGAFPAVDLEVDRRAPARFVLLADDFFAEAFFAGTFFAETFFADDFFADDFFADLDFSGLA